MSATFRVGYSNTREFYNDSGSTISRGHAVMLNSARSRENPVPSLDIKSGEPTIQACNAAGLNFIGIAIEDIADSTRGKVCIEGNCEALVVSGANLVQGDWVGVSPTAPPKFYERGGSSGLTEGIVHAMVIDPGYSTATALTADTLIQVYLPPFRGGTFGADAGPV